MNRMIIRTTRKRLLFHLLALMLVLSVLWPLDIAKATPAVQETEAFNVQVNVNKDGSFYVNETITATGLEQVKRVIPLERTIEFTDESGKKIKNVRMPFVVDSISVENKKFTVKDGLTKKSIIITNTEKEASEKQTYRISYRMRPVDDGVKAMDMFDYALIPEDWGQTIKEAGISVTMPSSFDKKKATAMTTSRGSILSSKQLTLKVRSNTLSVTSKGALAKGTGVDVNIRLPEGYFSGEKSKGLSRILLIVLSLIISIGLLVLWYFFGRDSKKMTTIETVPPEGMTPAEMGFVLEGMVSRKSLVSLVLWFADRGYLRIEEIDKKTFLLHKEHELPNDVKEYQFTFFEGLFACGDGTSVTMEELAASDGMYCKETARQLRHFFQKNRKQRVFAGIVTPARILAILLSVLSLCFLGWRMFRLQNDLLTFLVLVLAVVATLVAAIFGIRSYHAKKNEETGKARISNMISLGLLLAAVVAAFAILAVRGSFLIGALAYVCLIGATYFVVRFMQGRTKYGKETVGRILGFREFIREADYERLEEMMQTHPGYYSNILPYAYVLGTSKKWSKKFETVKIPAPGWYEGPITDGDFFDSWQFYKPFSVLTKLLTTNMEGARKEKFDVFGKFAGEAEPEMDAPDLSENYTEDEK